MSIANLESNILTETGKSSLSMPVNVVYVNSKTDFPSSVSGIITLLDNYTYYITTTVDLLGDRIVCGQNTVLLGSSSENCRLKSTGLTGVALISSNYSLLIRGLTIEADIALNLNGIGVVALDWFGVNFTNCNTVGTIANYNNFIMTDCAFLNSQGLTFDGTIGTVGFTQCLFDCKTGGTMLIFPNTCIITRRIRITYSSFIVLSGEVGINVNTNATVPVEGYILDTVNFAGGGGYLLGVNYDDNKALFTTCKGIENSASICNYYMQNNTTSSIISTVGVPVKILGTTVVNPITQKFAHTNNRATYIGAIARLFKMSAVVTVEASGVSKSIGLYFSKNGVLLTDSEIYATTSGNNKAENISIQTITNLSENDYIEVWVENNTDTTSVIGTFLNVIITPL